jgi:hypothetical protein
MLGPNARLAPAKKELLKPLVLEALDHTSIVTRNVTGVNRQVSTHAIAST